MAKLRRSEGYMLCKMMSKKDKCGCENRNTNPCASLVMFLRAGGGTAEGGYDAWKNHQRVRAK